MFHSSRPSEGHPPHVTRSFGFASNIGRSLAVGRVGISSPCTTSLISASMANASTNGRRQLNAGRRSSRFRYKGRLPTGNDVRESLESSKGIFLTSKGMFPNLKGIFLSRKGTLPTSKGMFPSRKGTLRSRPGIIPTWKGILQSSKGMFSSRTGTLMTFKGMPDKPPGVGVASKLCRRRRCDDAFDLDLRTILRLKRV